MNKKKKISVEIVRELCTICAKETPESIAKHTSLNGDSHSTIDYDHDMIMWSKKCCPECEDRKTKGFVLIGAIPEKTKDITAPYRTGNVWTVDLSVAKTIFSPHEPPASGVSFIDENIALQMELPGANINA